MQTIGTETIDGVLIDWMAHGDDIAIMIRGARIANRFFSVHKSRGETYLQAFDRVKHRALADEIGADNRPDSICAVCP